MLERKKGTFRRNPRRTKLQFRACETLDFPLLKWPFQGICARNLFQKYKNCINTVSDTSLIVPALCDVITDTASYRHCYLAFALGQAKFSVFSIFIKMAPWLLHCSKLGPRSFMPLTTRSKGASTMTDPRILEVAPTKGCSKQIHDLLAGGRFLLVPGCFCVGPSQIVSFANSIRIAP